jgi:hypothetical protein
LIVAKAWSRYTAGELGVPGVGILLTALSSASP